MSFIYIFLNFVYMYINFATNLQNKYKPAFEYLVLFPIYNKIILISTNENTSSLFKPPFTLHLRFGLSHRK